ncbi:hypothetical protein JOF48_000419 [Arthrobacter stackebrandtii]|uniref:Ammonium transporter AmtB-like domain-containing protein n=1 Tax=Arthrobacter stackebrandtii TaxID=272161 RepID=A0ABS4YT08_9MICC|nr:hypothetical protein [Arthrobacter stackebrandtii]MBP2411620.1 hypothetical protein [Arthrobacter stackebrandtii]
MDYDTTEILVGSVLVLLPIAGVSVAGGWCLRRPERRMPWFFFLGPVAAVALGWAAGAAAMTLFPPPYDAYFAGGSGLDLRGLIIVGGAMLGSFAGTLTSVVICAGNLVLSRVQQRRQARPLVQGPVQPSARLG